MNTTSDFIEKFISKSDEGKISVVALQCVYLAWCKINNVSPIPFTDLHRELEETLGLSGPFTNLIDPTYPFYKGAFMDLPEQDISEYKEKYCFGK